VERVTGIGGLFFRAKDPEALAAGCEEMLGVAQVPGDYNTQPWTQEAGSTAFAPFSSDTDYFGKPEQAWMINFRVVNLDRMIAQLQAKGVEVRVNPESYPNDRFARLNDPEGNPIELWEPKG
jgi:glyoxylase I family protein